MQSHSSYYGEFEIGCTQITVKDKPSELHPIDNKTIVERNHIASEVMKEFDIEVDDLYGLMSDKLHLARGDRFHWSRKAIAVQARHVASVILKRLGYSQALN